MSESICHRCGQPIPPRQTRYIAKIQVFAAPDLNISEEDLQQDHRAIMAELIEQCGQLSEAELMQDVYVEMEFILCRPCQRAYLAAPLPGGGFSV